jgi:predicted outer membrane protein
MKYGNRVVLMVLALGLVIAPKFAAGDDEKKEFNKQFVWDAHQWSLALTRMSELASDHAHDERVKDYAHKVIEGQKKIRDELHDIAEQHGWHMGDDLTDSQHESVERLRKLHGYDFDIEYLNDQRDDVQLMIDLFGRGHQECTEEILRTFAGHKIPGLRKYHDDAEDLYRMLKEKGHD